ncbi:MAG: sigma-54-dependent Fis family transcriptional regulator [Candidatus Cloacimonetes bacterium]|nr:sigma-54-dependent Fis family transcriptional regulator [Candidatus Cloacimonadota bacterium]
MERILIVEDEIGIRDLLARTLREEGYTVIEAENGPEALRLCRDFKPVLVLLDLYLPGLNGMRVLETMKRDFPGIEVIIISGSKGITNAVEAMKLGAYDYLVKPLHLEEMMLIIKKAIQENYLNREVNILRRRLYESKDTEKRMGESPQINKVLKQVELVAPTDLSIVIQGKSGTGKEVIASLIHRRSARCNKPMLAVDCGAIPSTLMESELFGYEKGAFTGAISRKIGKFEQANSGTLLLDEITNLPPENQVKLLRALEEKMIQRVGGKQYIPVNVRIIATTNTDIQKAVTVGNFREDLFHRINEFLIQLPELRERVIDIPILAEDFLLEANIDMNKKIEGFTSEAMTLLKRYHWPGNVRELKNIVKKAVLLSTEKVIGTEFLNLELDNPEKLMKIPELSDGRISLENVLHDVERQLILKALRLTRGNKTKTAALLSIDRKSLYRKMAKLEISASSRGREIPGQSDTTSGHELPDSHY